MTDADPRTSGGRAFATSRPDGPFAIDGLFAGTFVVEAGGATSAWIGGSLPGVQAGAVDVTLHVRPGVELPGTLVDEAGAPFAVSNLRADNGARQGAQRPYVHVGADGQFSFPGLKAGTVRLSAMIRGTWTKLGEVTAPRRT